MWPLLAFSLVICISFVSALDEYVVVKTKSGPVRGKSFNTLFENKPYYSFRGIPFAEEPVNELRFKPPIPKKEWKEIKDALNYGSICSQVTSEGDRTGEEDCLFLNIYTPDVKPTEKLAVMFYIHGGGFFEGSGNDYQYGPDFLINDNVILVTSNYRLGVFGFMSLGTAEYSGNMGLKDQQLALQWINDNIESFGGDRKRITLFGHSAGSGSVHYHVLAPSSKGLFNRAIMMSGVALNPWAIFEGREHMIEMYAISQLKNRQVKSYQDLLTFLKEVDAKFILDNIDPRLRIDDLERPALLSYVPVIEVPKAKKPFLQKTAAEIYNDDCASDIDVMFGFTTAEWLFQMGPQIADPSLLEPLNEHFEVLLPHTKFNKHHQTEEYKEMFAEIRNFYFGEDGDINNETIAELTDLHSDVFFAYGIDKSAKIHAKKSSGKTFYYRFSVDANCNMMKRLTKLTSRDGTSHGDEICYLFRCYILPGLYDNVTEESVEMSVIRRIVPLWTNFAKFGNPTPNAKPVDFQPITENNINFLDIHNDGLYPAQNPNSKNNRFWDELLEKYDEIFRNIGTVKDEL